MNFIGQEWQAFVVTLIPFVLSVDKLNDDKTGLREKGDKSCLDETVASLSLFSIVNRDGTSQGIYPCYPFCLLCVILFLSQIFF